MTGIRQRKIRRLLTPIVALATAACAAAGAEWPGWRGPSHDGSVAPGVIADGGAVELAVAWKRAIGSGYSSVSVAEGRAVTAFAVGGDDVVAAFDAASGEELWRARLDETYAGHDGSHDGPISTPLVAGGRVFALGPRGALAALDLATGAELWRRHLAGELEAAKPWYGFSTSPILVAGTLVVEVAVAEKFSVAGFDPASGELRWTAGDDRVSYQSPLRFELGGVEQVLAVGETKLAGLDPATGELLWEIEHGGDGQPSSTGSLTPVPAGDGRLLLGHKHDQSKLVRLVARDGEVSAEELWTTRDLRGSYVVPVYHDGHFYGLAGRVLACVEAATGETKWKSRRPGDGFLILVDGRLVIVTKKGTLHVAEASAEGYRERAALELFDGVSWTPASFAAGRIYARSHGEIAAIEVQPTAGGELLAGGGERAAAEMPAESRFGRFLAAVAASEHKQAVVDSFLAAQRAMPFVEGSRVVFLHRTSAADVAIASDVTGDRYEEPMHPVPGTDLFWWSTELEPDAAVKYRFLEDFERWTPDPRNPRRAESVLGETSWVAMPEWREPAHLAAGAAGGTVESFEIETEGFEGARRIDVYLPPGYAESARRYPVAYVHWGRVAQERGRLVNTLNHLIGQSIAPLIAVFVHQVPPDQVGELFGQQDEYAAMVAELVGEIDGRYRTIPERRARASVGAGFGGFGAFLAAFSHPDLFGKVAGQSVMMLTSMRDKLMGLAPSAEERPLDVYLDWARYDWFSPVENWDLGVANREFAEFLRQRGYRPAGGRHNQGWGWVFWRTRSDRLLEALFPLGRSPSEGVTTPGS